MPSRRDPIEWMWDEALELLRRAERMQRQSFRLGQPHRRQPAWVPPCDVYETARHLWILVALPGVPPERVEVLVDGGTLIVSGERPPSVCDRTSVVRRVEIPHGRFERHIDLPVGLFELDEQDLRDGCLILRLRKRSWR